MGSNRMETKITNLYIRKTNKLGYLELPQELTQEHLPLF